MPEYRTEWDGRSLLERHEISNNRGYAFTLLNDQLNTISKWSTGNQLKRQQGTKNYHLFYSLRRKWKIVRYIVKDFIIFALRAKCFGFVITYFKNHWHDRMEIEESKVNAELSQVRDIYVWVTTVYFGPNQTCFVQHHVGGACTTTYTWNASLNIVFDGFLGLF